MGLAGAAAAAGVAVSAGSAIAGASSSKTAGGQAAAGDQGGAALATGALGNITSALSPYTNLGSTATNALTGAMTTDQTAPTYINQANGYTQDAANIYGTLSNGISQQVLDNTPGYQFTLGQGLESTQNSAAARGLANSGAALKGAATYATGLANDTYQSQYNDLLSTAQGYNSLAGTAVNQQASLLDTNNQNYNQILQASQLGENAANQYGEYATNAAQTAAGLTASAGQATASGTTGAQSQINSGLSGASSSLTQGLLLNKLLGSTGSTSTGSSLLSGGNTGWTS